MCRVWYKLVIVSKCTLQFVSCVVVFECDVRSRLLPVYVKTYRCIVVTDCERVTVDDAV